MHSRTLPPGLRHRQRLADAHRSAICRIVAMRLELSLVPLYEGAPSITDIPMYTRTHGYELFHLVPRLRDERDGRLLQAEGFFVQSAFTTSNAARLP